MYLFSGCDCDSFVSQNGWGNCERFESDGIRTMCYVKNPNTSTCPDLVASSTDPGKSWSYKACEPATQPKPPTTGMSFQIWSKCLSYRHVYLFHRIGYIYILIGHILLLGYVLSPRNGRCDDIRAKSFSLVSTEAECRKAVAYIQKTVPDAKFVGTETEAAWPEGCYLYTSSNGVYFNLNRNPIISHKSARQICKEGSN